MAIIGKCEKELKPPKKTTDITVWVDIARLAKEYFDHLFGKEKKSETHVEEPPVVTTVIEDTAKPPAPAPARAPKIPPHFTSTLEKMAFGYPPYGNTKLPRGSF